MASLANIRALPGLYGGGFARVVQVETLTNGSNLGAVGQAAVRLERLQDPFSSFRQTLQQFSGDKAVSKPQPAPDGNLLTLLQAVDPQKQSAPQLPALGQQEAGETEGSDDPTSYAIELARAEARKKEARAEEDRKAAEHQAALQAFEAANAPKETLGPDPLAKLRQSLENLSSDIRLSDFSYTDLGVTDTAISPYAAAQAVQAYTSTLAAAG